MPRTLILAAALAACTTGPRHTPARRGAVFAGGGVGLGLLSNAYENNYDCHGCDVAANELLLQLGGMASERLGLTVAMRAGATVSEPRLQYRSATFAVEVWTTGRTWVDVAVGRLSAEHGSFPQRGPTAALGGGVELGEWRAARMAFRARGALQGTAFDVPVEDDNIIVFTVGVDARWYHDP